LSQKLGANESTDHVRLDDAWNEPTDARWSGCVRLKDFLVGWVRVACARRSERLMIRLSMTCVVFGDGLADLIDFILI
jgi:hypothetical protein